MHTHSLLGPPRDDYVFPTDGSEHIHADPFSGPSRHHRTSTSTTAPPVTHCPRAWRCLALGCFHEAFQLSEVNNDVICMAASLIMYGETKQAIKTMEAYIIASCVVAHERYLKPNQTEDHFLLRTSEVMASWMSSPKIASKVIGKSARANDEEYRRAVMDTCETINWDSIHRWFIIALFLYDDDYKPPEVAWFRYYFALFKQGCPLLHNNVGSSAHLKKVRPQERASPIQLLSCSDVEDILLSQCGIGEAAFISAVTAWKTHHYRSAITAATDFLSLEETGYEITDPNLRIMAYFIRCMSFIALGERVFASHDAVFLLRDEDEFTSAVGASLTAFLMPLPESLDVIKNYEGPSSQRRYAYALCEYIHALTLVQLGSMESAVKIIQNTLNNTTDDMGELLLDLLVIACTALEDSKTLLNIQLSPERQLYLAMAPVFYGGFGSDCAKLRTHTPAGRLLYPKEVPTYASLRQMLPFYMNRAHHQFAHHKYIDAWENVSLAVACAEEIIGSVEFAFTECSPLNVYYFGCCVGAEVLNTLLEVMTAKDAVARASTNHMTVTLLTQEGDILGEEVLRKCGEWAQRIRQFHPNVRLGSIVLAQYRTISRAKNFISRAICLAQRYPRSVLAQNCLTLALYANHHIPEAVDQAAKTLQTFPHSREVVAVHRAIVQKDGVYVFNYRTLFPVRYAPGSQRVWTKRMILVIILLFINFIIYVLTLLVNMSNWVVYPEPIKEIAVRLQLPSLFPLFYAVLVIVYAIMAAISPRNLVRTMMHDLFFTSTRLNCFLFPMRGLAFVNTFNALQITIAGNNFLFESHWYTFLLYVILTCLFVPFTSRVWFLSSMDEPKVGVWSWLTLYAIDIVTGLILLVPHIILFAIEPLSFIAFFFFQPIRRPEENDEISGHVGKRLILHQACLEKMSSRHFTGSGSRFIHIRLMSLLYYKTHPDLTTRFLLRSQIDEENYRIFPLIDVYERIPTEPVDADMLDTRLAQRRNASIHLFSTLRTVRSESETGESYKDLLASRRHLRRLTAVDVCDDDDDTNNEDYTEMSEDGHSDGNNNNNNKSNGRGKRRKKGRTDSSTPTIDLDAARDGDTNKMTRRRSRLTSLGKSPVLDMESKQRKETLRPTAIALAALNKSKNTSHDNDDKDNKETRSEAGEHTDQNTPQELCREQRNAGPSELLDTSCDRVVMPGNERCLRNRHIDMRLRLSELAETIREELLTQSSNPLNANTGLPERTGGTYPRRGMDGSDSNF
ncbi:uncharacterized protein TM35_000212440 [Trypanosoma theileri]|uniref:Uncharacterized protein n=1 Tax=Trypanosoma theileri TaxID=67003 RepID=A0A1X0NSX5_9TRYP|nr:uncharacterized protein TM35_000212440 [Trypanosoma theileri]ORC87638.1 hypothetical protein TM35_000212440 [Trypanosoma theileri]